MESRLHTGVEMRKKILAVILAAIIYADIFLPVAGITVLAAQRVSLPLEYDGETFNYDEEAVTLYLNGEAVTLFGGDMPPIILDDRLYVPVRDVFEALGATVVWNGDAGLVYIGWGGTLVSLRNGSNYINVNGELREMPLAPKIINGRTMAPVSFIAQSFGFKVEWFEETRTVTIDTGKSPASSPSPSPTPVSPPIPAQSPKPSDSGNLQGQSGAEQLSRSEAPETAIDLDASSGPKAVELAVDVSPDALPEANYPETTIDYIQYDPYNPQVFYIHAGSPIPKVNKFLLYDNRLVIDFYGAEMLLEDTFFEVESPFLSHIRTGQNQLEPQKITRVVFDLTEPVSYSVTFSADRKTLIVSFNKSEITGVAFQSDGLSDSVVIYGNIAPVVNIFPSTVPGKFIIEIPLGSVDYSEMPVSGVFASAMKAEQFSPSAARIVLDVGEEPAYTVTHYSAYTVIRLIKPSYQNIAYESDRSRLVIPKSALPGMDVNGIAHSDDYLNYRYSLTLPGDFSAHVGQGDYVVKDNFINYINISNKNGKTVITFYEKSVLAYVVTEDASNVYINAMHPKRKYPKIVIIDAGHGGSAPGAKHNGLVEKELTLDIAKKLEAMLANSGVKVYMTRVEDTNPTREDRAIFANEIGDLFISVHINSHDAPDANGLEVYYCEHENDARIGISGMAVADILQKNLLAELKWTDRKVKTARFTVIANTEIPAALCEIGFISNPSDAAKLATDYCRQQAASALYRSVLEIFAVYAPKR